MGKGTDKLYITHSEWSSSDAYSASAGSNVAQKAPNGSSFKRLPFNFCAASLQPFKHPVCTVEGTIFDVEVISSWLAKHGTNPVTGKPLREKDLIKLTFARNGDTDEGDGMGEMVDPVTFKVFTDNTHIVAIQHGTEANVFAWDTIERLNIKAKMWKDLVDERGFGRSDIITLQDPQNVESRNLSQFKFLKDGETVLTREQEEERMKGSVNVEALGRVGEKVLKAKEAVEKARRERAAGGNVNRAKALVRTGNTNAIQPLLHNERKVAYNAAQYTTGKAAASFTSTGLTPETSGERALLTDEEYMLRPKRVKIKGYARIETKFGALNVELQTETAPKAVWNFVQLAKKGYYKGVNFHRNIRNFMIQGGDPTGTGKGGASIWGGNFQDEFDGPLTHDARGIMSMANKGKNTNSSQFFILYRPAKHLDRKHTIFGRVVGGLDILTKLENVEVGAGDRPVDDITIEDIVVFVDPFEEFQKQKREMDEVEKDKEDIKRQGGTEDDKTTWTGKRVRGDGKVVQTEQAIGVGKYLKAATNGPTATWADEADESWQAETLKAPAKKKARSLGFGNFDGCVAWSVRATDGRGQQERYTAEWSNAVAVMPDLKGQSDGSSCHRKPACLYLKDHGVVIYFATLKNNRATPLGIGCRMYARLLDEGIYGPRRIRPRVGDESRVRTLTSPISHRILASMIAPQHSLSTLLGPETPTGAASSGQTAHPKSDQPQHKRVYQACIPCRRRKVKCDLGSVDNPSDPPCVRCRRESKECYFSATRRKRRVPGEQEGSVDDLDFDHDYLVRNGRKRLQSSDSGSEPPPNKLQAQSANVLPDGARPTLSWVDSHSPLLPPGPLTPGGHVGRTQPLRRPHQSSPEPSSRSADDSNIHVENPEAQNVMRREVYGPHDALDLLYKAATDSPGHKRARSEVHLQHYQTKGEATSTIPNEHPRSQSFQSHQMGPPDIQRDIKKSDLQSTSADSMEGLRRMQDASYKEALKAWARFRFVRAGWFTPAEAIDYIEYYYTYLSPLTPISPPTFKNPATHPTLLTEEPILTVTLLTIATRYRTMPGPGGTCRSNAIHEQLWTYLRGMVERCLWGQEAFGGGFAGAGTLEGDQTSSTAPWRGLRKGSLRTLGTVESLMILTEWHPRALHFPPAEATDELMLPSYELPDPMHENYSTDEDGDHKVPGSVGGKRIDDWLEPAWRSDRMCWMLLSTAMGLSYELGVFDAMEEQLAIGGDIARPEYEDESYRLRAARIKKLLLIYITQLAGRLGWTNMVPGHIQDVAKMTYWRRETGDGNTPGTSTTVSMPFQYIPDLELDDQIIHCWAGITNAMRIGNERLFRSRKHTTRIIQTGEYTELLKEFQPMLNNWMKQFEGFRMPPYIKHILVIEYEYVRIYVNSLSLQAVVERCTSNAGNIQGTATAGNGNGLSPQTQNYYGKLPLTRLGGFGLEDQQYVKEVVDGSRNLLRTVVEGLLPDNYLKHAPVRTYFRIISGAMFLLKTFALGASKHEIEISIGLMDKAVDALRTCVVDDVHLGTRFADLLETLTSRLRNRFMHAPPAPQDQQASPSRRGDVYKDPRHPWDPATPGYPEQNANDPNGGISATAFDLGQNAFYAYNDAPGLYDMDQTFGNAGDWSNASDMWYLPPGAAFFQNSDQQITQTAEGVNVGGIDLLDYMAMDQYQDTTM